MNETQSRRERVGTLVSLQHFYQMKLFLTLIFSPRSGAQRRIPFLKMPLGAFSIMKSSIASSENTASTQTSSLNVVSMFIIILNAKRD
jgi:hypothetical protein